MSDNFGDILISVSLDDSQVISDSLKIGLKAGENLSNSIGKALKSSSLGNDLRSSLERGLGNLNLNDLSSKFREVRRELEAPAKINLKIENMNSIRSDLASLTGKSITLGQTQSNFKNVENDLQKAIEKGFVKGFDSVQSDKLSSIPGKVIGGVVGAVEGATKSLIGIVVTPAKTIASGLVYGITSELGKGLATGISNTLERSISSSFGSTELLGDKLAGFLGNSFKEGLDNLPNTIESSIKSIGKSLRIPPVVVDIVARNAKNSAKDEISSVKKEAKQASEDLRESMGSEDIDEERLYRKGKARAKKQERKPVVREEAVQEFRSDLLAVDDAIDAKRNERVVQAGKVQNLQERLRELGQLKKKISISIQKAVDTGDLEKQIKLDELKNKANEEVQFVKERIGVNSEGTKNSIARSQKGKLNVKKTVVNAELETLQKVTNPDKTQTERIAKLADLKLALEVKIKNIEDTLSKDNEKLDEVGKKVAKSKKVLDNLAPVQYPQAYLDIVKQVLGDVPEHQIPSLGVTHDKGIEANYSAAKNKVSLKPEIYQAVHQGTLTEDQAGTIAHELEHSNQFGLGSFEGLRASDRNQSLKPLQKSSPEFLKRKAKWLAKYENPDERAVEVDAEMKGEVHAKNFMNSQAASKGDNTKVEALKLISKISDGVLQDNIDNLNKMIAAMKGSGLDTTKYKGVVGKQREKISASLEMIKDSEEFILDTPITDQDSLSAVEDYVKNMVNVLVDSVGGVKEGIQIIDSVFQKDLLDEPVRVQKLNKESLETLSKKEILPIAKEMGIDGKKLNKKDLVNQLTNHEDYRGVNDRVNTVTRNKALKRIENQERLEDIGEGAGKFAKGSLNVAQNVAGGIGRGLTTLSQTPMAQNAMEGVRSTALATVDGSKMVYRALQAVEGLALDVIPMGNTFKSIGKNAVLPAALYGAATHMIPGGQMIAGGIEHLAQGVMSPLAQGLGHSLGGNAAGFLGNVLPDVFGISAKLSAGVNAGIIEGMSSGGVLLANSIAAIMGGKALQGGLGSTAKAIVPEALKPLALPPSNQRELVEAKVSLREPVKLKQLRAVDEVLEPTKVTLPRLPQSKNIEEDDLPLVVPTRKETVVNNNPRQLKSAASNTVVNSPQDLAIFTEMAKEKITSIDSGMSKAYQTYKASLTSGSLEQIKAHKATLDTFVKRQKEEIDSFIQMMNDSGMAQEQLKPIIGSLGGLKGRMTQKETLSDKSFKKVVKASEVDSDNLDTVKYRLVDDGKGGLKDTASDDFDRAEKKINKRYERSVKPVENDYKFEQLDAQEELDKLKSGRSKPKTQSKTQVQKLIDLENQVSKSSPVAKLTENLKADSVPSVLGDITNGFGMLLKAGTALSVLSFVGPLFAGFAIGGIAAAESMERLSTKMIFASGSAAKAAQDIKFAKDTAYRLGTNQTVSLEGYANLVSSTKDTNLEGRATEQIFKGLSEGGASRQLGKEEMKGAMLAIQQMSDKGVISQEELRGQLSERLSGTMAVAARSRGQTVQEMNRDIKTGAVTAEEFLPKFTQQLSAESALSLPGANKSSSAIQNRFSNTVEDTQVSLGSAILPVKNAGLEFLTAGLQALVAIGPLLANLLGTLTAGFGVNLLGGLTKSGIASKLFAASLSFLTPMLTNLMGSLVKLAPQLLLFTVATEVIGAVKNVLSDASGEMRTFADESAKGLAKYQELDDKFKNRNAPKKEKKEDLEETALVDGTMLKGLAKTYDENGSLGDKVGYGARWLLGGTERNLQGMFGGATYAEKTKNDKLVAASDMTGTAASTTNAMQRQLVDKDSALASLLEIDKEIDKVQQKRRAIVSTNPDDKEGITALKKEEDKLREKQEAASMSVGALTAQNAASITALKSQIEEFEKLAAIPGSGQSEYANSLKGLKLELEAAEKTQRKFDGALKEGADSFTRFTLKMQTAMAKLNDVTSKLKLDATVDKAKVNEEYIGNSGLSKEQVQIKQTSIDTSSLQKQVDATAATIAEMDSLMEHQSSVLQAYGITKDTGKEELGVLKDKASNPKDKKVIEEYTKLQGLKESQVNLIAELSNSNVAAIQQVRDTTKSIKDFYRGIQDQTKQIEIETKGANNKIAMTRAETKLKSTLLGFQESFMSSYVDSLVGFLKALNKPKEDAIAAQSQILGITQKKLSDQMQADQLGNTIGSNSNGENSPESDSSSNLNGKGVDTSGMKLWSTGGGSEVINDASKRHAHHNMRGAYDTSSGKTRNSLGQEVNDMTLEDKSGSVNVALPAPVSGVVTHAGLMGGYGNAVEIKDSKTGEMVLMGHLASLAVKVGDRVTEGMKVGIQGGTGSGGTKQFDEHLHLEASDKITARYMQNIISGAYGKAMKATPEEHSENDGHNHGKQNSKSTDNSGVGVADSAKGLNEKQKDNARAIEQAARSMGLNNNQIAGVIASAMQESTLGMAKDEVGGYGGKGMFQLTDEPGKSGTWIGKGGINSVNDYYNPAKNTKAIMEDYRFQEWKDKSKGMNAQDAATSFASTVLRPAEVGDKYAGRARDLFGNGVGKGQSGSSSGLSSDNNAKVNEANDQNRRVVEWSKQDIGKNANSQIANIQNQLAATGDLDKVNAQIEKQKLKTQFKKGVEEQSSVVRNAERQAEDIQSSLGYDTPTKQRAIQVRDTERTFYDKNLELIKQKDEVKSSLNQLDATIAVIKNGDFDGAEALQKDILPQLLEGRGKLVENLSRLENVFKGNEKLKNDKLADIVGKAQDTENTRAAGVADEIQKLRDNRTKVSNDLASLSYRPGYDPISLKATSDIETKRTQYNVDMDLLNQQEKTQAKTKEEVAAIKQLKTEIFEKEVKITEATAARDKLAKEREVRNKLFDGKSNLANAQADNYDAIGMTGMGKEVRVKAQIEGLQMDLTKQLEDLDEYAKSTNLSAENLALMRDNAIALNGVKLDTLKAQMDPFQQVANTAKESFGGFFKDMLMGTKSIGEAFKDMVSNLLSKVADLAMNALMNDLFSGGKGNGLGALFGKKENKKEESGGLLNVAEKLIGGGDKSDGTMNAVVNGSGTIGTTPMGSIGGFLMGNPNKDTGANLVTKPFWGGQNGGDFTSPLSTSLTDITESGRATLAQGLTNLTDSGKPSLTSGLQSLLSPTTKEGSVLDKLMPGSGDMGGCCCDSSGLGDAFGGDSNGFEDFFGGGRDALNEGIDSLFISGEDNLGSSIEGLFGGGKEGGLMDGIMGLFGGGDKKGGGGLLGSILSIGTSLLGGLFYDGHVPNLADGNLIGKDKIIPNFAKGFNPIGDAMKKEAANSTGKPMLAVINDKELVLSERDTQKFYNLGLDKRINNYSDGNMINSVGSGDSSINVPVTINSSGGGPKPSIDAGAMSQAVKAAVIQEIQNQKRNSGLLNR